MNELRMYVEHLFEGKIVTSELIELKEEIYGNLVARYEDFIAEGMGEEEALRKTKESMESVDGLLEAEAVCVNDEVIQEESAALDTAEPAAEPEMPVDGDTLASEDAEDAQEDAPTPSCALDRVEKHRGVILGIAAVLLIVLLVPLAMGLIGVPAESSGDSEQASQAQDFDDSADTAYEETLNLETAINTAIKKPDMDVLRSCKDMKAGDDRNAELLQQLPLGDYLNSVESTAPTNLHLNYLDIPDGLDNSILYRGFVYDAFCLFAAIPDLERITIECAYDESNNVEQWFDFSRDVMEGLLDKEQGDSLNSSLFDNEDAWKKCVSKFMSDTLMDWINEQEMKG